MIIIILIIVLLVIVVLSPVVKYAKGDYVKAISSAQYSIIIFFASIPLLFIGMFIFSSSQKPIIYLYPEKEQEITVRLVNKDIVTTSYPKYVDCWKVYAKPNGDLIDLNTGRSLYALYWEGNSIVNVNTKEGFVVKGENSAKFLEEKLAILGLNEREAEEFIVYWLPKLESNKYNFIRFATQEELEGIMPLDIEPKPDVLIRVYMAFKSVNKNYKCLEQVLEPVERCGYTVVEWGGANIK